ncbi:hypothetical protein LJC48_07050 [Desulfovibrio sp. OttesenSCG-928-C06]|nr:hypothetical protein [Desulfovibrio sp. OttesenSCG-928-C06]
MRKKLHATLVAACLITLVFGAHAALASGLSGITLNNKLDESILNVKILYIDSDGDRWNSSPKVLIQPDDLYYFDAQDTDDPEVIILHLSASSYEFPVHIPSRADGGIKLDVTYEDGVPYLKMAEDPEQAFIGVEKKLFYPESGDYAVDRDYLSDCETYEDVIRLIQETAQDAGGDEGKDTIAQFTPIETFGQSETLYFPVAWTSDHIGYGSIMKVKGSITSGALVFAVSVPLNDEPASTIDDLMSDLRVDGYRPFEFKYRLMDDGDAVEFLSGEGDKYDDQDVIQDTLAPAMAKDDLVEAEVLWVKEEAFEKAKETGESPDGSFVVVRITPKLFQAEFIQVQ